MKSVDTLPEDIYDLFKKEDLDFSEEDVAEFGHTLAKVIKYRIEETRSDKGTLRMSNLGWPDCKLWYHVHGAPQEELEPHVRFKFLYGDILEELVLFLAKQAGHTVEGEQGEHTLAGIKGHRDAIVDGVLVDVKSAAPYSFKVFKNGLEPEDDKFGYIKQINAYLKSDTTDDIPFDRTQGRWVVVDKTLGHIIVKETPVEHIDYAELIEEKKRMLDGPKPPRAFDSVPEGKSGNFKLCTECSYCPFKQHCWSDANDGVGLRTFLYSYGPVHLTQVKRQPNVMEMTP